MRPERHVIRWGHTLGYWVLGGEKNGVCDIESENGPPWASSLRRVRLNAARASRALSSSVVR
jgi:hypothetical protein